MFLLVSFLQILYRIDQIRKMLGVKIFIVAPLADCIQIFNCNQMAVVVHHYHFIAFAIHRVVFQIVNGRDLSGV